MNKLAAEITTMQAQLRSLIEKTDTLFKMVSNSQGKNTSAKKATAKRGRVRTIKNDALKGSRVSASTALALQIIKRHKNGINVATLKKKAGFDDKKISNIVHRACKKGLIKRAGRGIYKCNY